MRVATFLITAALAASSAWPAGAQTLPDAKQVFGPLMHGALVYHGNYCGPGHRGGHPAPIDALDLACQHHDACTPSFGVPACACNARLHEEAAAVAHDPRAPFDEREAADFTAEGALAIPCK